MDTQNALSFCVCGIELPVSIMKSFIGRHGLELTPGMYNVIREPFVLTEKRFEKVLLPPLYIKQGLEKQSVNALDIEKEFVQEIR